MDRSVFRPRGIALISALIISTFLIALTGAFMTVNQSHFAILRNNEDQTRARRAAQAGLEYAFYCLEHDRQWGTAGVDELASRGSGVASAAFSDLEILSADGQTVEARYVPLKAELTLTVQNNLNSAPLEPADLMSALASGSVPAEHARVVVTASAGGGSHRAEAMVRLAPLYEDTLYANGEIAIEAAEGFLISSKDPFRNSIKATGDVFLPEVDLGKTKFVLPGSNTLDHKGILQSNGIVYNRSPGSDERLSVNDINKTGGRVLEEVQRKFSFFDLEPADLPVPGEDSQQEVVVASGEYRFTRSKAVADFKEESTMGGTTITTATADIDVLEYYDNPGDPNPSKVFRSYRRLYDAGSGTHVTDTTLFQYSNGDTISVNDANFVTAEIASYVALDGGVPKAISASERSNYKVVINLDSQAFDVASGTQVVPADSTGNLANGTLQVTNKPGIYAHTDGAAFKTPTLNLGENGTDVSIRAAGDIELSNAFTQGVGTLISEQGNISLKPIADGSFDVNSPSEGLALYAKKDVTVANPGQADWNFNGFVFAGDDFTFDANPLNDGSYYDVAFRGSVVAGNAQADGVDGIQIKSANQVNLCYEPEYLKFLNRNLLGPDGIPRDIALEYLYRKI